MHPEQLIARLGARSAEEPVPDVDVTNAVLARLQTEPEEADWGGAWTWLAACSAVAAGVVFTTAIVAWTVSNHSVYELAFVLNGGLL